MPAPGVSVLDGSSWDDIATTTMRKRSKSVSKIFDKSTALFDELSKKGRKKTFGGGRSVVRELSYQTNGTTKRYSGYESLNISPSPHLTAAEFTTKQAAVAVTASGLELYTNDGPSKVLDLLESRIENAERSLVLMLAGDAYSDGTADGGRQMQGLAALVSDNGLGTIGGIDSNTYSDWRNKFFRTTTNALGAMSSVNIQTAMTRLYLSLCMGASKPDILIADIEAYGYYIASLQTIQRITKEEDAGYGFERVRFMGTNLILDGGVATVNPYSKRIYMLNSDHIDYRVVKGRDFEPLNPTRHVANQDAMVKLMVWGGMTTVGDRRMHGVLFE